MAAASSSTPFLGIRQENQSQIAQHHQSSTAASSTTTTTPTTVPQKKRRNQPGTPYPDAEVIALSPKTLMATNRFICELCNKGFQREQNLQLHRRGHNLPWKLKQKTTKEPKRKVYLCPEPTCVHHDPSRALGDLTGIKKHYSRKHGEKKWKCDKCSKKYAVQSDWKAHSKTCGTREYRCDCGTLFSRRDSFITHRAFCDALAHESARHPSNLNPLGTHLYGTNHMNLGLGTQLQNQASTNSILSLGSAPKFEHLVSPNLHHSSSFGVQSPQSSFFMTDPSQAFHDLQSQQQGSLFSSNKQLHGLMQLPDLQGTTNNSTSASSVSANSANTNFFNLSFFPNTNSSGSIINDQFNNLGGGNNQGTTTLYSTNSPVSNQVGSGLSSLFGNSSVQQENMSPHMSATALLQKAAQMGSTTTTNGAEELGVRSSMENMHNNHLRGLINSLANGNTSIFGNVKGNENNLSQFHNVVEEPKKLSQNLGVCFGGSDKLTLDFLGVGGMVRNMSSGGFSQREQQHSMGTMTPLDTKLESAQANQPYGTSTLQ
ncbi:protein indeterminate-domain 5, chloroplastic-like [Abrus precatorius]|uniref:Protein indeterminate-domain 5, chloroplastic-like n=1 Tax=Abrus precatorius TaxID=3816 RepID=A0A8B8LW60_ABRPR|nr:protein indeterminate-domain 5, chloroplastic-like [Abrus precatorius]XP_027359943.1 protein indeterminate-domain 5, chloroplastic-like [Abrus precatorius]XP_027359944.1 protein indeterminate-domain 5, chloroplastic-like [Abrus precatorius]